MNNDMRTAANRMLARHYFAMRGIYPVSEIELLQKGYGVTNEEAMSIVAEFIGREVIAGRGSGFGFFAMNPDTVGLLELYDESGKSVKILRLRQNGNRTKTALSFQCRLCQRREQNR